MNRWTFLIAWAFSLTVGYAGYFYQASGMTEKESLLSSPSTDRSPASSAPHSEDGARLVSVEKKQEKKRRKSLIKTIDKEILHTFGVMDAKRSDQFKGLPIEFSVTSEKDADGKYYRARVMKLPGHRTRILVHEKILGPNGKVTHQVAMAFDHVTVGVHAGFSQADLEAKLSAYGYTVQEAMLVPDFYLINIKAKDVESVHQAVAHLREHSDLIRSVNPDYMARR